MNPGLAEADVMAKKGQKTTPVRLTDEAIAAARIASGYTGESMAEYVSRIVAERATEDARRYHEERFGSPDSAKPRGGRAK
jgi:hypothetical protein